MGEDRKYTASFILDMRGVSEPVDDVVKRLSGVVTELDGKVLGVENLGQKNFARVANRKFSNGIYLQIKFSGKSSIPEKIKSKLKLDKVINQVMIESDR